MVQYSFGLIKNILMQILIHANRTLNSVFIVLNLVMKVNCFGRVYDAVHKRNLLDFYYQYNASLVL